MPPPDDTNALALRERYVTRLEDGSLQPSSAFIDLLSNNRQNYDWPRNIGAITSQRAILELEAYTAQRMRSLNEKSAHEVVCKVSIWAGNNNAAQEVINNAPPDRRANLLEALLKFRTFDTAEEVEAGIDLLRGPGISLVIASKIYRFCCPSFRASVDRHASYFFNSLDVWESGHAVGKTTEFKREWSNAQRNTSRLPIYIESGYTHNLTEYIEKYLPLLVAIAGSLNHSGITYRCAVAGSDMLWRPTDIEMAAYYWWALSGAR
ncbi:MAG: hypothetical protein WA610_07765 [Thermodesulfovibrionales bacterium]